MPSKRERRTIDIERSNPVRDASTRICSLGCYTPDMVARGVGCHSGEFHSYGPLAHEGSQQWVEDGITIRSTG